MRRHPLRACQCGGRPAWVACVGPVGSRPRGELLRCPACGNRTGPGRSRERLAQEWNSAGWCGQGPAAPEYEPFGPEWRGQMMRMGKADLVTLYAERCKEGLAMERTVREQRARIAALEEEAARLRVRRSRRELAAVIDRLVQRGLIAKADAAGAKRKILEGGAS